MAFFIYAVKRRKNEREEMFLERIYNLKKLFEKQLNCSLKILVHFEDKKIDWIEIVNCQQKHPAIKRKPKDQ